MLHFWIPLFILANLGPTFATSSPSLHQHDINLRPCAVGALADSPGEACVGSSLDVAHGSNIETGSMVATEKCTIPCGLSEQYCCVDVSIGTRALGLALKGSKDANATSTPAVIPSMTGIANTPRTNNKLIVGGLTFFAAMLVACIL